MAQRQRYDDKFRASAVVLLQAAGYPDREGALSRTAGHLGIPRETLRRWAVEQSNPPPPELVTEKRVELLDLLNREIEGILGDMPDARKDASYRDLGTVLGILVDKRQLLSGEPTENSKTRIVIEYADVDLDPAAPAPQPGAGNSGSEEV